MKKEPESKFFMYHFVLDETSPNMQLRSNKPYWDSDIFRYSIPHGLGIIIPPGFFQIYLQDSTGKELDTDSIMEVRGLDAHESLDNFLSIVHRTPYKPLSKMVRRYALGSISHLIKLYAHNLIVVTVRSPSEIDIRNSQFELPCQMVRETL